MCKFLSLLVCVMFSVFFVHTLQFLVSYFLLMIVICLMFKFVLISTLLPCLLCSFVQWTIIISMPTFLLQCFSCSITLCKDFFMLFTFIYVGRFSLIFLQFMLIWCCIFVCILKFTCFLSLIVFSVRQFIEGKRDLKMDSNFVSVWCSLYCFGS